MNGSSLETPRLFSVFFYGGVYWCWVGDGRTLIEFLCSVTSKYILFLQTSKNFVKILIFSRSELWGQFPRLDLVWLHRHCSVLLLFLSPYLLTIQDLGKCFSFATLQRTPLHQRQNKIFFFLNTFHIGTWKSFLIKMFRIFQTTAYQTLFSLSSFSPGINILMLKALLRRGLWAACWSVPASQTALRDILLSNQSSRKQDKEYGGTNYHNSTKYSTDYLVFTQIC